MEFWAQAAYTLKSCINGPYTPDICAMTEVCLLPCLVSTVLRHRLFMWMESCTVIEKVRYADPSSRQRRRIPGE